MKRLNVPSLLVLKWHFQISNRDLSSAVKLPNWDLNPWREEVVSHKRGFNYRVGLSTLHMGKPFSSWDAEAWLKSLYCSVIAMAFEHSPDLWAQLLYRWCWAPIYLWIFLLHLVMLFQETYHTPLKVHASVEGARIAIPCCVAVSITSYSMYKLSIHLLTSAAEPWRQKAQQLGTESLGDGPVTCQFHTPYVYLNLPSQNGYSLPFCLGSPHTDAV